MSVGVIALCAAAAHSGSAGAHQSGCHASHACPSDHHSYVWTSPSGPRLDCARPFADEAGPADTIRLTYEGLPYVCHPAGRAAARASPIAGSLHPPTLRTQSIPERRLTPGNVLTTNATLVCQPGWARAHRYVPESIRRLVFSRYQLRDVPGAYEVDHLVALELGGSNAVTNLWPEPNAGRSGAEAKDRLENRLRSLVCQGRLPLAFAQRIIAGDWRSAYRVYNAPS